MAVDIVIYHNPECGTSRNTLEMIRQSGEEPVVIEYLKTPPSADKLAQLYRDAGITPQQGLRTKGTDAEERGLPQAERDRLTEPYVTTRAKGTGLGLAIVAKVMDDHGGRLVLDDRAGGGACVGLFFPADAPAEGRRSPAANGLAEVANVARAYGA